VIPDVTTVLDRQQLRDVTLDDEELMREIVCALIDDTSRQIPLLEGAIREKDPQTTKRLAHYSKGACANVGAKAAAAALENIERTAAQSDFDACGASLAKLAQAIDQLRAEPILGTARR
jgi:HPt (histidine-containing phosphotransfer) domain-containing protein